MQIAENKFEKIVQNCKHILVSFYVDFVLKWYLTPIEKGDILYSEGSNDREVLRADSLSFWSDTLMFVFDKVSFRAEILSV